MKCENCGHINKKKTFFCNRENCKTFGQTDLKKLTKNLEGVGIPIESREVFRDRLLKIKNLPIGKQEIRKNKKEIGNDGTELQNTYNFCACLGFIDKKRVERQKKKSFENPYYDIYERVENQRCKYLKRLQNKKGDKYFVCSFDFFNDGEVND